MAFDWGALRESHNLCSHAITINFHYTYISFKTKRQNGICNCENNVHLLREFRIKLYAFIFI